MKTMVITILSLLFIIIIIAWGTFYYNQEKLIFYPEFIRDDFHYPFKADFKELNLKSDDASINCLHFKTNNSKGIILYFHGNSGSLDTWGLLGEDFVKTGFDFFIFDYRGYGKSKGPKSEEAFHKDCQVVYEHVKKSYPEKDIIVYGRSLGSGFATKVAANNNPKSLILETPYYNFTTVAKHHFPFLPIGFILRWNIQTDKWITKVKCPILIFHGTKDEVIPYKQAIKLKDLLKKEDTFITIEGGTHNNMPSYPEYAVQMKKYIE
jgi:alpha-beta hydrolase superfamily lysophospholipase